MFFRVSLCCVDKSADICVFLCGVLSLFSTSCAACACSLRLITVQR
nr:MAG TPA: hypothetical protein [Caudoviricetes sp.]